MQPLGRFLKKVPPVTIGLDLGSSSLKGVKLQKVSDQWKLLQVAVVPIAPQLDSAQRVQAVQQAVEQLSPREAQMLTAVGGAGTVLRRILFPKMSSHELKASLAFEAEKHIPFKLDEVFLDFSILGDRPGGRMEVLLAAARRDLVNEQLSLLSQAGLAPQAIDLETIALANAWEVSHPGTEGGGVALLHVGCRGTLLDFLCGGQLEFAREISIGGNAFTEAIAQALQLDGSEAERIKCQPDARWAQVQAPLQASWEDWLNQCRASFDFYENQYGHRVERLVLSGGSARLTGFKEWVQEAAGFPTEVWDPLGGMASEADPTLVEKANVGLGVALGLAVRGFSA